MKPSFALAAKDRNPPCAAVCAVCSIKHFGLVAAVSRIAAILLNGLDLTNMNGPNRTFVTAITAAVKLLPKQTLVDRSAGKTILL
jgi:hypothetical protein